MKILNNLFLDEGNKICARRIMGITGFIICMFGMFIDEIDPIKYQSLIYASSGLLGITTFDKIIKKEN